MQVRLLRIAVLASALVASAAYAAGASCFLDGLPTQHTGRYQQRDDGRLIEAKCPRGHSSWIRG